MAPLLALACLEEDSFVVWEASLLESILRQLVYLTCIFLFLLVNFLYGIQIQAELGEAYDQPQQQAEDDDDDDGIFEDDYSKPFRFLTQWTCTEELPLDMEFSPGTVVRGWLMPAAEAGQPKGDEDATQPQQPSTGASTTTTTTSTGGMIPIELQPQSYCLDRSPTYRGYWLVTEAALYWLHAPAAADDDRRHVMARAVLTCLSDLLYHVFPVNASNKAAKRRARSSLAAVRAQVPGVDWELVEAVGDAVAPHLVEAHPALKARCAFVQSLQQCSSGSNRDAEWLRARCRAVEARLPQTAWGQPRALPLAAVAAAQEDDESEEDAMSVEEQQEEPEEASTQKKKSKRSSSRAATGRAKRAKAPPPSDSSEEEEDSSTASPPSAVATSPSSEEGGGGGGRRRRAATKRVNYADDDSDEFDDEEDSDEEVRRPARSAKKPKATKKANRKVATSKEEEEDFLMESSSSSDSDELSDVEDELSSSEDDDLLSSEDEKPRAKRKGGRAAATKKTANTKNTKAAAPPQKEKSKMCDMFAPMNAPSYSKMSLATIQEEKEFLDPCGMEATDDIIDRLVGDQVDKIGSLLQRALANDGVGSRKLPLQLGTACSGTDAPALALTLVSEQMEHRGLGGLFQYTHEFSCENDPFKQGASFVVLSWKKCWRSAYQLRIVGVGRVFSLLLLLLLLAAYLARNFDSVLYPDIAKLCDDPPRDVYGQEKELPPFNLFVAGTSCKKFSMLRSTKRLDIEDKGCSGETFIAATEVLFKEKPQMAIFENVIGAPWVRIR